jgi:rfaE bifunctional protein kinase chain/domain
MAKRVSVIGDVMLDKYDFCTNRDNPESSAPCYTVKRTEHRPGGAGNVAANLASLGTEVDLVGIIGNDENGQILSKMIKKEKINPHMICEPGIRTIVKERVLSSDDGRYHLRKDLENGNEPHYKHIEEIKNTAKDSDIIIISDYNKGTISAKLMQELKQLDVPIIVDPKPANMELYKNVFLITPNLKEGREMTSKEFARQIGPTLVEKLKSNVLLTKSQNGVSFFGKKGERYNFPAEAEEVFDVTGAGDTIVAAFTHFYIKGNGLEKSVQLANRAAGIAVRHPGCYQVKEEEII